MRPVVLVFLAVLSGCDMPPLLPYLNPATECGPPGRLSPDQYQECLRYGEVGNAIRADSDASYRARAAEDAIKPIVPSQPRSDAPPLPTMPTTIMTPEPEPPQVPMPLPDFAPSKPNPASIGGCIGVVPVPFNIATPCP
jgi:hypothetical protein